MPIELYLFTHKEARLSIEETEKLANWTKNLHFIHQLGVK